MATNTLELDMDAAVLLLKEAGVRGAAKKSPAALAKMLKGLPARVEEDDEDPAFSKKSGKLFDEICEAIDEKAKIVVVADGEDEEEEEIPRSRKQKATAKASSNGKAKAKGKKGVKSATGAVRKKTGSSGPTTKDKCFDAWMKKPSLKIAGKLAAAYKEVQKNTIRSWLSTWKNDTNFPRGAAKYGKKDIAAAVKAANKE